jgi:hypothetical protein
MKGTESRADSPGGMRNQTLLTGLVVLSCALRISPAGDPRKSAKRNGALNFGPFMDSNISI